MSRVRPGLLSLLALVLASGTALAIVDPGYRRDRHAELLTLIAGGLLGALTPVGKTEQPREPGGSDPDLPQG